MIREAAFFALLVNVERHRCFVERHIGNYDAGGMLRGVAQEAFELERISEQFRMSFAFFLEARLHFKSASLSGEVATLLGRRIELDDFVGLAERETEYAADIALVSPACP